MKVNTNKELNSINSTIKAIEELPRIMLFRIRLPFNKFGYLQGEYSNHTKLCYILADNIDTVIKKFGNSLLDIEGLCSDVPFFSNESSQPLDKYTKQRISNIANNEEDLLNFI